jgi:aminoglycoside phosphotransferase (APT) family kinase protein
MTNVYEDSRSPFLEVFGERLAPEVRQCVPNLNERVLAAMEEFDRRDEYTIVHGDFRIDNIFFGRQGGPYELAVIDWQSPNRGWGAYDLAYFMSGSMPPEQRRAGERAALERYHETLTGGGVRSYSFDELLADYRASLMVYLAIFVVNGATLERSNERAVQLFEVIFDRLNAAILDHDATTAL